MAAVGLNLCTDAWPYAESLASVAWIRPHWSFQRKKKNPPINTADWGLGRNRKTDNSTWHWWSYLAAWKRGTMTVRSISLAGPDQCTPSKGFFYLPGKKSVQKIIAASRHLQQKHMFLTDMDELAGAGADRLLDVLQIPAQKKKRISPSLKTFGFKLFPDCWPRHAEASKNGNVQKESIFGDNCLFLLHGRDRLTFSYWMFF